MLTETSNLLGQLGEPLHGRALVALGALTGKVAERYIPSTELATDPLFYVLGLSDTSIIHSAERGTTVLTDDLQLYLRLSSAGVNAVNFNHLRSGAWN